MSHLYKLLVKSLKTPSEDLMPEANTLSFESSRKKSKWVEEVARSGFFLCALASVLTTFGIVFVLIREAIPFFQVVPVMDFLFGTKWNALIEPRSFGVIPLFMGTMMIVLGSGLIAIPIGLASAIYLSEFANDKTRKTVKPILEILAGIPTVVSGYFALTGITPLLKLLNDDISVFNALSASIVVAVMILPMVASLCDDALRAVPRALREGGFALGSTKTEVSLKIVVPAALSGIVASFVLAFSRAIGETMAVTLAAGATPKLTMNPLESIQTMTAYIVQVATGDIEHGSVSYHSLYAVGGMLFLITLGANLVSHQILKKYREQYE